MDAPVIYMVRYWVAPEAEEAVLAWIDGSHLADVAASPGFLWGRRYVLGEAGEDGWRGFVNIYGVESEAALEAYFENGDQARYQAEAAAFAGRMRAERSWAIPA